MTIDALTLHRLLTWTSPGYPTGAFSYSHGLEQAVEDGAVTDRAGLIEFVAAAFERGGGWIDAALFVHAWRSADDPATLADIADLASAFRATAETALESRQQGAAFLDITRAAWPHANLDVFAISRAGLAIPHTVAVAVACRAHGVTLAPALEAYLHGFAANLVSAGVRLIPLGQTDGQIALAALAPRISATANAAQAMSLDDLGVSAIGLDILSMRHETQYTRLFRS
jgi:urease accessory protein